MGRQTSHKQPSHGGSSADYTCFKSLFVRVVLAAPHFMTRHFYGSFVIITPPHPTPTPGVNNLKLLLLSVDSTVPV